MFPVFVYVKYFKWTHQVTFLKRKYRYTEEFALFFPPHFPEKCSNISFKLFIGLTLAKYFFFLLKSRLGLSILGGKVTIFV